MKVQCIRSKFKWIDEGKAPTKYFIYLETQNYTNKQILNIQRNV